MDRYTRKDATKALQLLCEVIGHPMGFDEGEWFLDYNSTYGGCVVAEKMAGGGEHEPFGSARVPTREFCHKVNFAIRAIEHDRAAREVIA